jgi:WD40 repeat protein
MPAIAASFSDNGSALLTGADGRLRLVRPSGAVTTVPLGYLVRGGQLTANARNAIAFNEFGAHFVDVKKGGSLVRDFPRTDTLAATVSRDGSLAATGHAARTVRVWRTNTGERIRKFSTNVGDIVAVAISPGLVASANSEGIAQVWRLRNNTTVAVLGAHTRALTDIAFSPDTRAGPHGVKHLVTASRDGTVRIWNVGVSAPLAVLRGRMGPVRSAEFVTPGTVISADGNEARLWDTRRARRLRPHGTLKELLSLANGRLAATGRTLTPAERRRYLG